MLLNEGKVKKQISKEQSKYKGIKEVAFRYNINNRAVLIDTRGAAEVCLDEDFYDNVFEDILSIDSFCLTRLAKRFRSNMDIKAKVFHDGYIDFNSVQTELNFIAPEKIKDGFTKNGTEVSRKFFYHHFSNLVPFYPYIKDVEFVFQNYRLCNIAVRMDLDLEKVNSLFETKNVNHAFLKQWIYTGSHILNKTQGEHSMTVKMPVMKGLMRMDLREESFRERHAYHQEGI